MTRPAAAPTPTPGPWTVERGTLGMGRYIAGPDGVAICQIASNTTPKTMQRERDGIHEANARLIAAAPDLRDALRLAAEAIEQAAKCVGPDLAIVLGDRAMFARAALVKAGQP